jgi:hypothetical protein
LREGKKKAEKRRRKKVKIPEMDRIILDRVVEINQEVMIEGPLLEALRFQGGRVGRLVTLTDAGGKDFRGRVLHLSATKAEILIVDRFPSPTESPVDIVLLQALPEFQPSFPLNRRDRSPWKRGRPSRRRPTGGRRSPSKPFSSRGEPGFRAWKPIVHSTKP